MSTTLHTWAEVFAKQRALPHTVTLEHTAEGFKTTYKNKQVHYIVVPNLKTPFSYEEDTIVVTHNTKNNVKHLLKHWDEYSKVSNLWFVFANEHSSKEKYWIIHPHVHNMIAAPSTLKQGIESIASLVDWCSNET